MSSQKLSPNTPLFGVQAFIVNRHGENNEEEEKIEEKVVSFGGVTIHIHNLTLGDNPGGSTRDGPPLTIEWENNHTLRFNSVDEYRKEHAAIGNYYRLQRQDGGPNDDDDLAEQRRDGRRAKKIEGKLRSSIAALDHTPNDLKKTLVDIYKLRQQRLQSKNDDIEKELEKEEEARERALNSGFIDWCGILDICSFCDISNDDFALAKPTMTPVIASQ